MHSLITIAAKVPDISPRYDAPFFQAFTRIASWVLGVSLVLAFVALILAILAIMFRGVVPERARSFAAANIGWVFLGLALLGSISGVFAWLVGFDLGF